MYGKLKSHLCNTLAEIKEAGLYKSNEALNSFFVIRTVSDDADVCAANNAEGKNAEKGLSINSSFFLLNPNG